MFKLAAVHFLRTTNKRHWCIEGVILNTCFISTFWTMKKALFLHMVRKFLNISTIPNWGTVQSSRIFSISSRLKCKKTACWFVFFYSTCSLLSVLTKSYILKVATMSYTWFYFTSFMNISIIYVLWCPQKIHSRVLQRLTRLVELR